MITTADPLTIVFGSLGGLAALVVAINTVMLRRDTQRQKATEQDGAKRMDTFEVSQSSLEAALARADLENERLRNRLTRQDEEILALKSELLALRIELKELKKNVQP